MTASEIGVLDLLLDRRDSSFIKIEPSDDLNFVGMKDNDLDWPDPGDNFLNSILQEDRFDNTPLLDSLEGFLQDEFSDLAHISSAGSDSGLSTEMEPSPIPVGLSPLPSDGTSDSESSVTSPSPSEVHVQEQPQPAVTKLTSNEVPRVRRIIRMTPVSSSCDGKIPRSILVPMSSIKNGQNVRTIRIIKAADVGGRVTAGIRICSSPIVQAPILSSTTETIELPSSDSASDDSDTVQYPRLALSNEEKRLLKKEGISLPSHYPLTKLEERELKRIRRKIRNKISAQDSRKRKKEYVDGLEERVKRCTDENASLIKRVKALQNQNCNLVAQVKRLQAMLTQGSATRQVQPATCLMVLLLSLALVVMPNVKPGQQTGTAVEESGLGAHLPADEPLPVAGRSRTLLYNKYPVCSEELPFLEEAEEELCSLKDHDYEPPKKLAKQGKQVIDYIDVDDVWPPPKMPPDQYGEVSSSLDKAWPREIRLMQSVHDVLDGNKPNATATRAILLNVATEK